MSKKTLCDWSRDDIDKNINKLSKLVSQPKFICRKCARVSNKEGYLCKPEKL